MFELIDELSFHLKNIDYRDYQKLLDDEELTEMEWFGICLAPNSSFSTDAERYSMLYHILNELIRYANKEEIWYIRHEYKILPWFNNLEDSILFPKITECLNSNKTDYSDKSIIKCKAAGIEYLTDEIVKYPSLLNYKDIECINDDQSLILKFNHHNCMFLLTPLQTTINFYLNKVRFIQDVDIKILRTRP